MFLLYSQGKKFKARLVPSAQMTNSPNRTRPLRSLLTTAVRLPAAVIEALKLKEGDDIEIRVADARKLTVARKPGRQELLKRLRAFRGRLPPDFKFDRDEANAR